MCVLPLGLNKQQQRYIYIYTDIHVYIYISIYIRREDSSRAAACRADIFPSRERAEVLTVAILF